MNDTVDMIAYGTMTIVGVILAIMLTGRRNFSIKFAYTAMLSVGAITFYILSFTSAKIAMGITLLSLIAIPIVAINSFPFALVGAYNRAQLDRENDTGEQPSLYPQETQVSAGVLIRVVFILLVSIH